MVKIVILPSLDMVVGLKSNEVVGGGDFKSVPGIILASR